MNPLARWASSPISSARPARQHRAVARAIAAAGAEDLAELFRIDRELVVESAAAAAAGCSAARIVSGSVQGEDRELACVPVPDAGAAGRAARVDDVEAVARGTGEGTDAASQAAPPVLGQSGSSKSVGQKRAHCCQDRTAVREPAPAWPASSDGSVLPANRARPFSVSSALRSVPSPRSSSIASRAARVVRAAGRRRCRSNDASCCAAGKGYDGGRLPAAVVEIVLRSPS